MVKLPIPLVEWDLSFQPWTGVPGLSGLGESARLFCAAAGWLLLVALALLLYRAEARLVSRKTAAGLFALRALVLTVLWVIFAMHPSRVYTREEVVPGRVVVALDLSDSMSIHDPNWTDEERRELAERLNLSGDFTRLDVAMGLLAPGGRDGLLKRIGDRHSVDVLAFTQDVADVPSDPEKLRRVVAPEAGKPARATASYTNLKAAMESALQRSGGKRRKLIGVVLVSDGQPTWGGPPAEPVAQLGEQGIPVIPVAPGPRKAPPDIAIESAEVNGGRATVFKGANADIETRVRVTSMPAGPVKLRLDWPPPAGGGKKRDPIELVFDHDGRDRTYVLRMQPKLDRVGTEALSLKVGWGDDKGRPADAFPKNDGRVVRVNVAPDKAKVLLIDGAVRWEQHYLEELLRRDPIIDLKSVVFGQPRLGRLAEREATRLGFPALRLPGGEAALAEYDCVILGDVDPADLPAADRQVLERYVAERGGTLVVQAGKRSMPLDYARGGDYELFRSLLPVEALREAKRASGFGVALTGEGRMASFLQMEADPADSLDRWRKLPRQYWAVVGRAKRGAVALAYPEGIREPADAAGARKARRGATLIARQNYGFGRAVYVGMASTWRWRFKTGDKYHHRFWGQVIRWAATDKPIVTGDDNVRFGSRAPVYREGQEVELLVRLGQAVTVPAKTASVGVRLIRLGGDGAPDKLAARVPLKASKVQPRMFQGKATGLPPGDYAVELIVPDAQARQLRDLQGPKGDPLSMRATFKVQPPDSAEQVNLAVNYPLLEEAAARTGGEVYTPFDADELVDRLVARSATEEYTVSERLRQSWWALGLFLALVTAEWVIRKRAGLA